MRVIVCGGRDYTDREAVRDAIEALPAGTLVIHGAAPGADTLAGEEAERAGFDVLAVPADWYTHDENCYHRPRPDGRCPAAGPRRNRLMLTMNPDMVLAFPGGRGTRDMIQAAKEAGVRYALYPTPTDEGTLQ